MALFLKHLTSKEEVDTAISEGKDKVVVLRFGKDDDESCLKLDNILSSTERPLSKMAEIYLVDVDKVPIYVKYFDITLMPSTVFFFNSVHIKIDGGTPDNTKFIGCFLDKQDFIDLVEVVYRGAKKGKQIVTSPIDPSRVPKFDILYKGF